MGRQWLALLTLAACSSAYDGRVYRGDGFAFHLPEMPAPWQRVRAPDAALAFRDTDAGASVLVNARCVPGEDDVPLSALTQHLFLSFTHREIDKQEVVPFDGREAMHTMLRADLDGVPLSYEVWVLKKDGCVYDMIYFAPPGRFERGRAAFAQLVRGFTTAVPEQ
jgi:hypothetical protein